MISKLIATIIIFSLAALALTRYRALNNSYDKSRREVTSDGSFRVVYKILVIIAALAGISSFWFQVPILIKVHDSDILRLAGSCISVAGIIGFEASVRALGTQYSPCFDLRAPTRRIVDGPYRWVRHPMYISNVVTLVGAFVASGSIWLLLIATIVGVYYFRSARIESSLLDHIPRTPK